MYHPVRIRTALHQGYRDTLSGPFSIFHNATSQRGFWSAYEHGAPDGDADQRYFSVLTAKSGSALYSAFSANRGAYFDGQVVSPTTPHATVWYAFGFFTGDSPEDADGSIWRYLLDHICEIPDSRKPLYYYNTWGMQRDESTRGNDIRAFSRKRR